MMVPGSNLLTLALTVIGSTPVRYFGYQSVENGETGLDTVTYADPVTYVRGSVQPVDRNRYEALGLDWEKSYIVWYVPNLAGTTLSRNPDNSGDVVEAPVNRDGSLIPGVSRRYQLLQGNNWFNADKWMSLVGVDIGPATGSTTNE
jgi:hypothetical protein